MKVTTLEFGYSRIFDVEICRSQMLVFLKEKETNLALTSAVTQNGKLAGHNISGFQLYTFRNRVALPFNASFVQDLLDKIDDLPRPIIQNLEQEEQTTQSVQRAYELRRKREDYQQASTRLKHLDNKADPFGIVLTYGAKLPSNEMGMRRYETQVICVG
ncbi:hypothetical protein VTP01DRAFT_5261 [Rhizomucor pusillus]|uniref:uncharacterized protein n=1 Tax=Rhizomucor pusillus TaxID=4840 RepID=UPI0037434632